MTLHMTIQWFPGHMAKALKQLKNIRKDIDVVAEVLDARAPESTRNPIITDYLNDKPTILLLNKTDLADPGITKKWTDYYTSKKITVLGLNTTSGDGFSPFITLCKQLYTNKHKTTSIKSNPAPKNTEQDNHKNTKEFKFKKPIHLVIFGIPNTGKTSILNRLVGKKKDKVADKPGVTRRQTWYPVDNQLYVLDTPGILWPKFEHTHQGYTLGALNTIKNTVLPLDHLSFFVLEHLQKHYPQSLINRYKLDKLPDNTDALFEEILRKRGCILSGGKLNYDRGYDIILQDFRHSKFGRISLDIPND